jgi:mannose-6-phosphate isomerase-like protein (cupin superfamily)
MNRAHPRGGRAPAAVPARPRGQERHHAGSLVAAGAGQQRQPLAGDRVGAHTTHAHIQSLDTAPGDTFLGGPIHVRVRSEDTDGRFGLIEHVVPGGFPGPALHVHPSFEETFYVIEGEIAVRVGDEAHEAGPGTVAVVPRGTPTRSPTHPTGRPGCSSS